MKPIEELFKLLRLDRGYRLRPRIVCSDGFIISVQASYFHYCTPRNNSGPYSHVELGFPSDFDEILFEYSEDASELSDMTQTVFPYTPLEVLYESLKTHGDFELEDDSFEELSENERSLDFSKYFT